jgi:hypothetical protein
MLWSAVAIVVASLAAGVHAIPHVASSAHGSEGGHDVHATAIHDCVFGIDINDQNLGLPNMTSYEVRVCQTNKHIFQLTSESRITANARPGDRLVLELASATPKPGWSGHGKWYHVVKQHHHEPRQMMRGVQTLDEDEHQFTTQPSYSGERSLRILALIAEFSDGACDFMGATRGEREKAASDEIAYMSDTFRASSWNKFKVNLADTKIKTIEMKSMATYNPTSCPAKEATRAAQRDMADLSGEDLEMYDALIYYIPKSFQTDDWCGVGGWAFVNVLPVNFLTDTPQFTPWRDEFWQYGIVIRHFFAKGTATALGHEMGHLLGFGHAGGTNSATPDDEEAWKQNLAEYGDNSAIMGNDSAERNTFSAVARFKMGWLPVTNIARFFSQKLEIKALSSGPADGGFLAAAFECPACVSKILLPDGTKKFTTQGGYLWVTFKGDGDECTDPEIPCVTDHADHYTKLFVHYQRPGEAAGIASERWYYLDVGGSYTPPDSGYTVNFCSLAGNTASVVIKEPGSGLTCDGMGPANPWPPPPPPSEPMAICHMPDTFDAGWGDCPSYGNWNYDFCTLDAMYLPTGPLFAVDACPECGVCSVAMGAHAVAATAQKHNAMRATPFERLTGLSRKAKEREVRRRQLRYKLKQAAARSESKKSAARGALQAPAL